jgi:hypothetical protein
MKRQPLVRLTLYLLALGGVALFTILLLKEGVQDVASAITSAGWGVVAILFFISCRWVSIPQPGG